MRIGFACKYVHPNRTISAKQIKQIEAELNVKSTTHAFLNKQTKNAAFSYLEKIIIHNITASQKLLHWVSNLPPELKMLRLTSDLLPFYTHPIWKSFYKTDIRHYLEKEMSNIGNFAKINDIRLSFHPAQYVVFASDKNSVIASSIAEFEYHADLARWMGYGKKFQDIKCNIHVSGRGGISKFLDTYKKLSTEAKNIITVENDEYVCGLNDILSMSDYIPIVLDIHHHLIHSNEYITPNDPRIKKIIESWRGVRPVIHYSYSKSEYLKNDIDMPNIKLLVETGTSKSKLRAHSECYPNKKVNEWALLFLTNFDIMCECKLKNIGAQQLYTQFVNQKHKT